MLCASARSPIFRLGAQVVQRSERGPTLPQPLRIVLDETIIPQEYAKGLIRALYADSLLDTALFI